MVLLTYTSFRAHTATIFGNKIIIQLAARLHNAFVVRFWNLCQFP